MIDDVVYSKEQVICFVRTKDGSGHFDMKRDLDSLHALCSMSVRVLDQEAHNLNC